MANNRRAAVKRLKTLIFTPKSDIDSFRNKIEKEFSVPTLPNRVECKETIINSIPCDILTPEVYATDRVMVYIHGGSFIGGSRNSWRGFCASLANASSTRIIVPEIRLAPQFPFPAALEDVKQVIKSLYQEDPFILIGADSSGASIAMALLVNLKGRVRHKISKIILFSPWMDFSDEAPICQNKKAKDEIITSEAMKHTRNMYTFTSNLTNPLVSPQYIQSQMFEEFPEIFIQVGEKEILLNEVKKFCTLLEAEHVKFVLDIWPDMMHLFQFADDYLEESHLAIDKIGKYIREKRNGD